MTQTILVAGATCDAGMQISLALGRAGHTVIAADGDRAALLALAAKRPKNIEPLCTQLTKPQAIAKIGGIWAAEPLDAMIILLPVLWPHDAMLALKNSELLVDAFALGLRYGAGRVIIITHDTAQMNLADDAALASYEALIVGLAQKYAENDIAVNGLHLSSKRQPLWPVVEFLLGPGARAISGAMIPLTLAED